MHPVFVEENDFDPHSTLSYFFLRYRETEQMSIVIHRKRSSPVMIDKKPSSQYNSGVFREER